MNVQGWIAPQMRKQLLGVLLLLSFLLYANCIFNGFVYDDHSQIERNPYVHSFKYVGKLFGSSLLAQQGKQAVPNFYRPLTNLAFLVGSELFGESPFGFHLMNILLHCTVVWLVFLVGGKLFDNEWQGLLAASLFAVHPIHVEPVAWIDGIGDPLVTVFLLLAFWFFLRLGQTETASKPILYSAMILSFAAATFTKETAVVFPVLATIFEHFYRDDRLQTRLSQKLARYGGLWLTLAGYIALRVASVGQLIPSQLHAEVTRLEAVYSALALIGQYGRKLIWPVPLIAFYPFQKSTELLDPKVSLGVLTGFALLALFIFLRRRSPLHSYALLWMGLTLAPALNTRWMTASVFAERYLYLPSVAFSWLAAGCVLWIWNNAGERARPIRWILAGALGILAGLGARTIFSRTFDWRSDRTLIVSTLAVLPDSPHMHVQYGMFRWAEGDHAEAEREWLRALSLYPESVEAMAELGRARLEEKQYGEAETWLQKAIALKPHFATAHVYLAEVYDAEGKSDTAEAELLCALEIHPNNTAALSALGAFYTKQRRLVEAARQFRASVEIYSDVNSWTRLGKIYDQLGQPVNSAEAWGHVVEFERFNPDAHRSLGQIYLARHQWNEAQAEFQMCLLLNPHDAVAIAGMKKIRNSSSGGDPAKKQP